MANSAKRQRRLWDAYAFPGFRPQPTVRGVFGCDLVDQYGQGLADCACKPLGAGPGLGFHEARQAFLFQFLRHLSGQGVGGRALDRRIGETSDAVGLKARVTFIFHVVPCRVPVRR